MTNIPENVLVDDCDREMLESMGKWHVNSLGYCVRSEYPSNSKIYMHRIIMNPPEDMVVDHINHNRHDNRRENLRVITKQQNHWNQSGVKGYRKKRNKFEVSIKVNNKNIYIGTFNTEKEAREAYLKTKQELHKI